MVTIFNMTIVYFILAVVIREKVKCAIQTVKYLFKACVNTSEIKSSLSSKH